MTTEQQPIPGIDILGDPKRIIAFCGFAGSGKSTAAHMLAKRGYKILPIAAPLKAMLQTLGLTHDQTYGSLEAKETPSDILCGRTPRHAMQTLGTEWGRMMIHKNVWIEAWAREAAKYEYVVCDDLRFENEARVVRRLGGKIVRVLRNGCEGAAHASEQELGSSFIHDNVVNNGTLRDLEYYLVGDMPPRLFGEGEEL